MSSLGFTNPWFLTSAAAIGIPVLIHYLTRARPRRIKFPPFQFLLEACAGQQTLHRLRVWIVLAVRCLAVLALVLLFSRPFLRAPDVLSGSRSARRIVLVLDASLSMRAVLNGVSLFAKAQGEAADLLRSCGSDTEAAVILMGRRPNAILPALSPNLSVLHRELVQQKPSFEAADPTAALALAKRLLGDSGVVYVFSDFQRSNWNPAALDELRGLPCFLRPVAGQGVDNAAITSVRLSPAESLTGEPIELTCTVLNSSPRQRQETVRLELESVTQEKGIVVPPYSSRDATFAFSLSSVGSFPGKVAIGLDNLPEDNVRYFTVGVRKGLQALLVSDADANDHHSAAFFVNAALLPSPQTASGLTVVRRHGQDTDRGILETADVFVLVTPVALSGEAAEIIARRLTDGAELICLLDGPAAPTVLAGLAQASKGKVTAPYQLLRPVTATVAEGDALTFVHVAGKPLSLFANPDEGELSSLRFRRHYQNQVGDDRRSEVVLSFADGSAALTLSPMGKGAAVFANLALAPDASNLAGSPLFPALLHDLLRALRRSGEERETAPGENWYVDAATMDADLPFQVTPPGGKPLEAKIVSSGRSVRLALPPAEMPGHYRVTQGDRLAGVGIVNVDPRESDTQTLAIEETKRSQTHVAMLTAKDLQRVEREERPLWPWFAAAAAALLGIEMLLLALWRPKRPEAIPPLGGQGPGLRPAGQPVTETLEPQAVV